MLSRVDELSHSIERSVREGNVLSGIGEIQIPVRQHRLRHVGATLDACVVVGRREVLCFLELIRGGVPEKAEHKKPGPELWMAVP